MLDTESETCLYHPVVKKYVDIKWRNRGFKYFVILILAKLLFHISLMVYTTRVIGFVSTRSEMRNDGNGNVAIIRESTPPNATEMVVMRVIIVVIAVGDILRELFKVMTRPGRYFADIGRYYKIVMLITVMLYVIPVGDKLRVKQISYGAVAVFLSWLNLMQVLKLIPVLGVYIILVEKVFFSVAKAGFIIGLELFLNKIPLFKSADILPHSEPRKRENSFFQKISNFILSNQKDHVDAGSKKNERQLEMELTPSEYNVDKAIEVKLENLYTKLQQELSEIRDQLKNWKDISKDDAKT